MSLLSLLGFLPKNPPLDVGQPAPELSALDENGDTLDLTEIYRRGLTLVYFYPMASTPGCTAQACSLRDGMEELRELGVTVVGVTHDSPARQKKFKEHHHLPFLLISDQDSKVARAFGVGTIAFGIPKRQSFLIKEGVVVWRTLSAQTKTHAAEVKQAALALGK